MTAPAFTSGKFRDSEELSAAVAAAGLDIKFDQLDRGKLEATLKFAIGRKFVVQHFDLGRRFHQRGAATRGLLTFGLPDHFVKVNWSGRNLKRDVLLNFSRLDGYESVSESGLTGYTFSCTSDAFQQAVSALDESLPAGQVHDMADYFSVSGDELKNLRSLAYCMHQCARNERAASSAYDELEADLAHALALSVCRPKCADSVCNLPQRQRAVNKALELILSTQDAISVSEVYKHSCVSWRTLDRAFKERFGITPKQYIVATRLIGVRRALLSARPGTIITRVANDWGFWHLGRFSSDYKRMFCELPSQTLCR